MVGEQRPLTFQQVDRKEITAASDKVTSVVRHKNPRIKNKSAENNSIDVGWFRRQANHHAE